MFRSPIALLILVAAVSPVAAQDDEESPFRPGLIATYTAADTSATRTDEVIAFDWQDAAPDPRLPLGEFTAKWTGRLMTQTSGAYRLHCYVQGEVDVKLAGQNVLSGRSDQPGWIASQSLEYGFDRHELAITFRKTSPQARLALFWSGPDFRLEPIGERFLMHDRAGSPSVAFERGRQLAAALRCAACHKDDATKVSPAPALDRLSGNIHEHWLNNWLSSHEHEQTGVANALGLQQTMRRMPDLQIKPEEATAIAAWLLREPAVKVEPKKNEQKETKDGEKKGKKAKGEKGDEKPKPSAEEGEKVILTKGCLACHQDGQLGESGLFGGGDLANVFYKRSPDFLLRWLENPTAVNRTHRMPVFTFNRDEMESLKLWAESRHALTSPFGPGVDPGKRSAAIREGEKHVAAFRCANCHLISRDKNDLAAAYRPPLTAASDWVRSCAGEPEREKGRPGYHLAAGDQGALKAYYSQGRPGEGKLPSQAHGRDLLIQLNCLACHQREGVDRAASLLSARLQDKLTAVAEAHDELAPLVPAMTPPALNSVGDKLHDAALAESIRRKGDPHRPYLLVQMPKFDLTDEQLGNLTAYFTATDRIPSSPGNPQGESAPREGSVSRSETTTMAALAAAGPRLVTADGLACASCHQVGSVMPSKAPLNARGPTLSMLEKRIRKEWFDRWCDNPARIVPRMEMPSVKVPVRGVLNEKIDDQLAAVWHILNIPGFEPPEPNPVRVLRLSGVPEKNERPIVIHDVFKEGDKTWLYPLVIGLPNRHNILFDLETNRLAAWWLGDTARQRTKGKSWFWEMGGKPFLLAPDTAGMDPILILDGVEIVPERVGQFASEVSAWSSTDKTMSALFFTKLRYPVLKNSGGKLSPQIQEYLRPLKTATDGESGFVRDLAIQFLPPGSRVRMTLVGKELAKDSHWNPMTATLDIQGKGEQKIRVESGDPYVWKGDGTLEVTATGLEGLESISADLSLVYTTRIPTDQFLIPSVTAPPLAGNTVEIAPGMIGSRLPLPGELMPSGLDWKPDSTLVVSTLKGEVLTIRDGDQDGLEDQLETLVDGLATPYGVSVPPGRDDRVDISAKTGLIRLALSSREGAPPITVCNDLSAWGRTEDYHDWAVGPVRGRSSDYFIALPCQQDQRSEAAASYRGKVIRLTPRMHWLTPDDQSRYDIEVISAGHRFPMGMAMNREGELFVTDNQGNYNPFNELNHVKKGAHFGFINALEKEKGYQPPPLTEAAINIPHPWTRSVNGICFLDTPVGWDQRAQLAPAHQNGGDKKGGPAPAAGLSHPTSIYGPLEGHLVGCEYDTRRLIRMSLQKVNGEYQGCAYPLSIPPADVEKGLLGPIVCAIKPTTGELYVGEIRDSGWGASNNIGQIVKIKIEPEKLPCGIAEVRATATGFTIDFFQPVDESLAANIASYSISSYRRESTPAYGGPDLDRREERISTATVSENQKRVTLTLPELRAGHVYELRLKNLALGGGTFHPDEAHYTLKQIPQ